MNAMNGHAQSAIMKLKTYVIVIPRIVGIAEMEDVSTTSQ
jgi:hypothetical protein